MAVLPSDAPGLGRELAVPLDKLLGRKLILAAALGLLGAAMIAGGIAIANRSPGRPNGPIVEMCGIALVAIALFVGFLAARLYRHSAYELVLGIDELRVPTPASSGVTRLRLDTIQMVATTPGFLLVIAAGHTHRVPLAAIRSRWQAGDLVTRIMLRSRLARRAAPPDQVAGAEALVLARRPVVGAAVVMRDGEPVVLGIGETEDDVAELLAGNPQANVVANEAGSATDGSD